MFYLYLRGVKWEVLKFEGGNQHFTPLNEHQWGYYYDLTGIFCNSPLKTLYLVGSILAVVDTEAAHLNPDKPDQVSGHFRGVHKLEAATPGLQLKSYSQGRDVEYKWILWRGKIVVDLGCYFPFTFNGQCVHPAEWDVKIYFKKGT